MILHVQSREGHTTIDNLTEEEVRVQFDLLTTPASQGGMGFLAWGSTKLDNPQQVRTLSEARERGLKELTFTAPLVGG